jgi:hypothetical protein
VILYFDLGTEKSALGIIFINPAEIFATFDPVNPGDMFNIPSNGFF